MSGRWSKSLLLTVLASAGAVLAANTPQLAWEVSGHAGSILIWPWTTRPSSRSAHHRTGFLRHRLDGSRIRPSDRRPRLGGSANRSALEHSGLGGNWRRTSVCHGRLAVATTRARGDDRSFLRAQDGCARVGESIQSGHEQRGHGRSCPRRSRLYRRARLERPHFSVCASRVARWHRRNRVDPGLGRRGSWNWRSDPRRLSHRPMTCSGRAMPLGPHASSLRCSSGHTPAPTVSSCGKT